DGDGAVEMSIERPVDHAHAALAELGFYPVMAEGLADHWFMLWLARKRVNESPIGRRELQVHAETRHGIAFAPGNWLQRCEAAGRAVRQKSMCSPNCTIRGELSCVLRTPNDWGDCRLTLGPANCPTLNALKSWPLNVVLQRSVNTNLREIARPTFQRRRPRS